MHPIYQRLGELYFVQQQRELTTSEMDEIAMCLKVNAEFIFKLSRLYNYSSMACMTNDWDWLHEIYMEIDKLEIHFKAQKPSSK
ncbi:DUF7667 family protein [Paenibacillus naphthalenovorans]|uniref:Uncharacterized protein n=1 Tax=Paenibacillus naphthalenovorans TaxID=162209 RepID=A0A0U2W4A9_9BACL|nr:hypothetical protein [Paenibacillus naphthalenovorans]ALS22253.1 hypothetical protein IJ22_18790 [Paenibacillus naphthalenovorans]